MADLMKPCVKCGAVDRYSDGACRPCKKARNAAYFKKHQAEIYQSHRQWAEKNKDKANAYSAKWAAANPEKVKAYSKSYYAKNRNTLLEKQKTSATRKLYASAWRKNNREKCTQYTKLWQQKNRPKMVEKWRRHKAKRRAISGTPSPRIIERLMQYQRGLCACCGEKLANNFHLDHILPIALGGTSEDFNLQLLCAECNIKKGAKHPVEYMQSIGKLL
jgi:5-methylcytosine-specific restriction endonuclease McrA